MGTRAIQTCGDGPAHQKKFDSPNHVRHLDRSRAYKHSGKSDQNICRKKLQTYLDPFSLPQQVFDPAQAQLQNKKLHTTAVIMLNITRIVNQVASAYYKPQIEKILQ